VRGPIEGAWNGFVDLADVDASVQIDLRDSHRLDVAARVHANVALALDPRSVAGVGSMFRH